ncbi:MAG: hypothetical protein KBS62_07750 [Oscillospiraceae bacterium]|nr:hypothetical protein [Candidatus Ruminococcus equi]
MKKMKKKIIALVAIALVACCVVGGSLAWISAVSDPVENVFVVGDDIDIELDEPSAPADKEFPIVPDKTYAKDPTITVAEGSAPMYLFFKVNKSDNLDDFVAYEIKDGWTKLDGVEEDVYYKKLAKTESETTYPLLKGGQTCANGEVKIKDTVTKEMIEALTEATYPTLTFTAYAIQAEGMTDAKDAWNKVQPAQPTTTAD